MWKIVKITAPYCTVHISSTWNWFLPRNDIEVGVFLTLEWKGGQGFLPLQKDGGGGRQAYPPLETDLEVRVILHQTVIRWSEYSSAWKWYWWSSCQSKYSIFVPKGIDMEIISEISSTSESTSSWKWFGDQGHPSPDLCYVQSWDGIEVSSRIHLCGHDRKVRVIL